MAEIMAKLQRIDAEIRRTPASEGWKKAELYAERENLKDEYLFLCSCQTHAQTRGYMDMD